MKTKTNLTLRNDSFQWDFDQFAAFQFICDKFPAYSGNAKADFGKFNEKVHAVDFQHLFGGNVIVFKIALNMPAGHVFLVHEHNVAAFKVIDRVVGTSIAVAFPFFQIGQVSVSGDETVMDVSQRNLLQIFCGLGVDNQTDVQLSFL